MNKEKLVELGLTDELATKVLSEFGDKWIPKSRFDEVNNEMKKYRDTVTERDKQLDELKKASGDADALKKQIEELQGSNKKADEAYKAELHRLKVEMAVDKALGEARCKNIKATKSLLDLTNADFNDDGTVKGLKKQIEGLLADESSKFLFDVQQETTITKVAGGFTPTQKQADGLPNASGDFQARLAEARKAGNMLDAIRIKREATEAGITLL